MRPGETIPSAGQGRQEKVDPKKTVYRTPEGGLSNVPVPGMFVEGKAKEPAPVSAVSLMHERAKALMQESEVARLSLQKGARQEAVAQTRLGGKRSEDGMGGVEGLRAAGSRGRGGGAPERSPTGGRCANAIGERNVRGRDGARGRAPRRPDAEDASHRRVRGRDPSRTRRRRGRQTTDRGISARTRSRRRECRSTFGLVMEVPRDESKSLRRNAGQAEGARAVQGAGPESPGTPGVSLRAALLPRHLSFHREQDD